MNINDNNKEENKLEELKITRKELISDLNNMKIELNKLVEIEIIKRYDYLNNTTEKLTKQISGLNVKILKKTMIECNHIWITSLIENSHDGHRNDRYEYYTCVKCGLNTRAREAIYGYATEIEKVMTEVLNREEHIMVFLNGKPSKGIITNIICQPDLVRGIYNGIISTYPNITDELIILYLRSALNNIRTKTVSEGVQERRVKRLGLHPNFSRWNSRDVIHND